MKKHSEIFTQTDCLSEDQLLKYVQGSLPPTEKHRVEKHLIDCEMCSDAVEGLQAMKEGNRLSGITNELNTQIKDRVKRSKPRVISVRRYLVPLAVAASVLLILGLIWFLRTSMKELDSQSADKMFAEKFEPAPAEKAPEDYPKSESVAVTSTSEPNVKNTGFKEKEPEVQSTGHPASGNSVQDSRKKINRREELSSTESGAALAKENDKSKAGKDEDSNPDENNAVAQKEENHEASKPAPAPSRAASAPAAGAASPSIQAPAAESGKMDKSLKKQAAKSRYETAPVAGQAGETYSNQSKADSASFTVRAAEPPGAAGTGSAAMSLYNQQDYPGAIAGFEQVLQKNPNDEAALFYSGVSYLSTGQTDKAIERLNQSAEIKNGKYYDDAEWYLALAYIKNKDAKNARIHLKGLKRNPKSKYQQQAEKTLKELDK